MGGTNHLLSDDKWEQLCDGCARCCLIHLHDEHSGEYHTTSVACRYLDIASCRCQDYPNRRELTPNCIEITPENIAGLDWLPASCSYRLYTTGRSLPDWHPLNSGCANSVHDAGISVRHLATSESDVEEQELERYIVD